MATTRRLQLLLIVTLAAVAVGATAQRPQERARPAGATRVADLDRLADELAARARAGQTPLYFALRAATDGPQGVLNASPDLLLTGVVDGRPRFYGTTNLFAARSVGTDRVWPGGDTGLDLDGANLPGELAVWDAGKVLLSHREFGGRVAQLDGATVVNYHGTHVAGTLVAAGVSPLAQGMSHAAWLDSYDWALDDAEMATAAAAGLLISNHSYANVTGWNYSGGAIPWYWYGDPLISETEDPGFGWYGPESQGWDQIAADAPYYLIVKAAGNDRDDFGPIDGAEHYIWDTELNGWALSTTVRAPDGGADGYDTIPYKSTAKNILTVGAVWDVDGGYSQPSDVAIAGFSNYGPTDDGRLKPDLVANGMGLYSCYTVSDSSYIGLSGTSMAAPSAAGSLHLLAQLWKDGHAGQPARSATLKAIALQTADECGPFAGPDFSCGYGLLNTAAAGLLIADEIAAGGRVVEAALAQGRRDSLILWSDGLEPLTATLCWTDPAGPASAWGLDAADPKLVNNLDLRFVRLAGPQAYLPWLLDPANPALPASIGDNNRDNVEQIELAAPPAGWYLVQVSHKGVLSGGGQAYSLVLTGFSTPVQAPVVTDVSFAQRRDGSGLVDIGYDVSDGDSPTVTVTIEASADGGATWTLTVTTVSGDAGAAVPVGTGKAAVWDFAADHPDLFLPAVVVRVTALD